MYIIKAEQNHIDNIVGMSVRAFETDINCGGKKGDYPPGYDSIEWHRKWQKRGGCFKR